MSPARDARILSVFVASWLVGSGAVAYACSRRKVFVGFCCVVACGSGAVAYACSRRKDFVGFYCVVACG